MKLPIQGFLFCLESVRLSQEVLSKRRFQPVLGEKVFQHLPHVAGTRARTEPTIVGGKNNPTIRPFDIRTSRRTSRAGGVMVVLLTTHIHIQHTTYRHTSIRFC